MIVVKKGVIFHPDSFRYPCVMRILAVAHDMAPQGYNVTVTSGCDGTHKTTSKHYTGCAFDLRTRDFPASIHVWARRIQNRLGDEYFVLVEATHMHIQWNGARQ